MRFSNRITLLFLAFIGLLFFLPYLHSGFSDSSRMELSGLIDRSPFLPPDHNRQETPPPPPRVEQGPAISQSYRFTGLLELGDRKRYAFHDLQQNRGFWVNAEDSDNDIKIVQYDSSRQRIMIRVNNQTGWLSLERPALPLSTYTPPEPERQRERVDERRTRRVTEDGEEEQPRWPRRRRVIVPEEGGARPERT